MVPAGVEPGRLPVEGPVGNPVGDRLAAASEGSIISIPRAMSSMEITGGSLPNGLSHPGIKTPKPQR